MKIIEYVIIAVVLIVILLAIIKATKKDAGLDFNRLVELLGGKDNIVSTETNMSRFKVVLKDVTKADKEGIQKLGAKGIVENVEGGWINFDYVSGDIDIREGNPAYTGLISVIGSHVDHDTIKEIFNL